PATAQPDPGAVVHPGRDAHVDLLGGAPTPGSAADRARVLHHHAASATGVARLGDREHTPGGGGLHAAALTVRTHGGQAAGARPRTVTGVAGRIRDQLQGHGDPVGGIGERDGGLALDVTAPPRPAATGTAPATLGEEAAEDVTDTSGPATRVAEQV